MDSYQYFYQNRFFLDHQWVKALLLMYNTTIFQNISFSTHFVDFSTSSPSVCQTKKERKEEKNEITRSLIFMFLDVKNDIEVLISREKDPKNRRCENFKCSFLWIKQVCATVKVFKNSYFIFFYCLVCSSKHVQTLINEICGYMCQPM